MPDLYAHDLQARHRRILVEYFDGQPNPVIDRYWHDAQFHYDVAGAASATMWLEDLLNGWTRRLTPHCEHDGAYS